VNQPRRVARVQADGRLVEHIERAHQPRAERGGQLNALRLAAGERGGQAVEREVFQADRVEKTEPLADLFEDRAGNLLLHGRELERVKELLGLRDGERGGLADVLAVDAHAAGLGAQALAAAVGALGVAAILAQHHAHVELVLLALHLRKEAIDADEAALAAQHRLARRLGQVAPGHVQRHAQFGGLLAQLGEPGPVLGAVPGIDGAVVAGQPLVGNDQVQVEVHVLPKPWQRGQAPKGLLKLKRRGSGSRPGRWQLLHS
jgi:hypothetical protein